MSNCRTLYLPNSMKRILVIRFSSIGDVILTTPVVRVLRQKFPKADIRYVTKPQFAQLVEPNPYLNGVFTLDRSISKLASELKTFNADLVVDLHHNLRTRILKTRVGGKWLTFNKLNVEKWLKVNLNVDKLPETHIVNRYLETLKPISVEADGKGLDFFFPPDFIEPNLPTGFGERYVAIMIGAKFKTKQLPAHKLVEVVNGIELPVVLIGGKEDLELSKEVATNAHGTIHNACGEYSISQSAWVLKQAAVVLTHDTGMMHIAAAFNKKIISVWGNTISQFGMYPYLPQNDAAYISEVKDLNCRPCSKIGYDKCPKGHFKCMENQDVKAIVSKTQEYLKA